MISLVPCTPAGASSWTQRTTLDGVSYTLRFDWSQRGGQWSLDIEDVNGDAIASGIALVTGYPLLARVTDPRRPPGELVVFDTQALNDLDPGFADLGSRFVLAYATRDEFAS